MRFLSEFRAGIFLKISRGPCTLSEIGKNLKIGFSIASICLKELKEEGLIITEKEGRKNIIYLTQKGEILAKHLRAIKLL